MMYPHASTAWHGSPILRDSYNKRFLKASNSRNLSASIGDASFPTSFVMFHRAATLLCSTPHNPPARLRRTRTHAFTYARAHASSTHHECTRPRRPYRLPASDVFTLAVADRCLRRCRPLLAIPSAQLRHTHARSRACLPTRSLTHALALAHARARPRMLSPMPTASPLDV